MTASPNYTSPASSLSPIHRQLHRAALAAICALMGVAATTSGADNGAPFITGETLGVLNNNTSNQNGFKFTVGVSPITVISLGRWVVAGNTGTHTVYLKSVSDGATLGMTLINTSGAAAGAFKYAALGTPVALAANTSYYLLSQEMVGGDLWYGSSTALTATGAATINNAEYFDGTGYHMIGSAGAHSQGPVNFTCTATTAPFITGETLGVLNNNTSNQNGFKFTVGASPITVTGLGRWAVAGNTGTHTMYLKNVSDGATLGTTVVNTSGATPGAFKYAALAAPMALAANTSYYLLSQEMVGRDLWYGSSTALTFTGVATINNAEYFDGTSYHMIGSPGAHSQGPVSFTYTTTIPSFDHVAVSSIMRLVADYDINLFGANNDGGWVRSVFQMGILSAYRALGDLKYRDYALHWGTVNRWQLNAGDPRFADNQACVQTYAELYLANPIPSNGVMLTAAEKTFDAMVASPLPGRQEWWWEDALFMAPPALVRVAKANGKTQYLTLMNNMFWDTKAFLFDPAVNLFWRDASFINSNIFWSRGNGWVLAGIARILEVLPTTDSRHADYEKLFIQLAGKARTLQAADGFWRSSLLAPNTYPNPESSGTALFTFAIACGINQGLLDRGTYLPIVTKAWNALVTAVNAQGRVGWVQPPAAAPGSASQSDTSDYGAGAFLLAGEQILKL